MGSSFAKAGLSCLHEAFSGTGEDINKNHKTFQLKDYPLIQTYKLADTEQSPQRKAKLTSKSRGFGVGRGVEEWSSALRQADRKIRKLRSEKHIQELFFENTSQNNGT